MCFLSDLKTERKEKAAKRDLLERVMLLFLAKEFAHHYIVLQTRQWFCDSYFLNYKNLTSF